MTDTADKPTKIDEVRSDVDLPEYPEGAPELLGYLQLPRRRRAEFMSRFADLAPVLEVLSGGDDDTPEAGAGKQEWADYARTMGVKVTGRMTKDQILEALGRAPKYIAQRARAAAQLQEALASLEDLLRDSAADQDLFDEWKVKAGDDELMQLFNAFMARTRPGEALSSAG